MVRQCRTAPVIGGQAEVQAREDAAERRKLKTLSTNLASDAETLKKKLGAWIEGWMSGWIERQVGSARWRRFYGLKLQAGAKYLVAKEGR